MGHQKMDIWDLVGAYPVCPHCQSEQVVRDAWAEWHIGERDWTLKTVFDAFCCDKCGVSITEPAWKINKEYRLSRIRRLNDQLRIGRGQNITIVFTQGIKALGEDALPKIMETVASFNTFSEENDPRGEHDFGAFELLGEKIFWKIDYFDRSMKWSSPDPANDVLTWRVLTIMLAREY